MAGLIPQNFIDDLLDRIDIVDVVDPRCKLKKTGKNYSACCPFHDEKTPSFTVSPDKQFYYCFGCGANGTALSFILEYDRLSFPDAVEELAKMAGIEVPREAQADSGKQQQRRNIYEVLEKSDQYFRQQLRFSPAKQHAINYLQSRGLNGEIARDFGIGYAPPGWDNLMKNVGLSDDDKKLLSEGGMIIERPEDNKRYDRFRNRIMFPIKDVRGRVIGFGGRVLAEDDAQGRASAAGGRKPKAAQPKYLNSPETPVFHKGQELYGLYEARMAHKELPRLLVVEGYMDVVALAQYGIRYGVATLGTACGEDHLVRAFKYTNEVVFCFDGDNAGRKAARRALESSLGAMQDGRQVKFLFLPDGEDPDTLVRQVGTEKFTHLIEMSVPLEDFLFDHISEDIDIQSMEGRARLSKRAAPLLNKLPTGVFRELMFANLAQRTGLSLDILMELVNTPAEAVKTPEPSRKPQPAMQAPAPSYSQEADNFEHPPTHDMADVPPAGDDDYSDYQNSSMEPDFAPSPSPLHSGAIKLPPQNLLIAILLQHPELAQHTPAADQISHICESEDPELKLFVEINELMQQRPHYNKVRIIGFWRGTKSPLAIQHLEELAKANLPGEARRRGQYDPQPEYLDILKRIESSLSKPKTNELLANLTSKNFNELSENEKQQLKQLLASRRA